MCYIWHDQLSAQVEHTTLNHFLKVDKGEGTLSSESYSRISDSNNEPTRKCRRKAHCILKVPTEILCKKLGSSSREHSKLHRKELLTLQGVFRATNNRYCYYMA